MKKREPIRTIRKSKAPITVSLSLTISLLFILGVSGISSSATPYDEALLKYREGNYAEAIDILTKKTQKNAGDHNLLGWSYLNATNTDNAIREFRSSLSAKPSLYDSYCGLGYAYFRLTQFDNAVENFTKGMSKDRKSIDCLVGLGLTYEKLHNNEKSELIFREVLSLDKDNQIAKEKLAILPSLNPESSEKGSTTFHARGDYFWIRQAHHQFQPIFVKGVNMSFALPGKFPSEFPEDEKIYLEWLTLVGEMNANVIRVYTILPPQFYKAFRRYNDSKNSDEKLYLIQGIWAELPEKSNFRDPGYLHETKMEIRNAVDVVHGKAKIAHRFGHAHGVYRYDVSDYVLGFIFGREWEPPDVISFNKINLDTSFRGKYLSISNANPMEVWLTEILDYLISYETDHYTSQRPVTFMNWPPLDPLYHQTEATFEEQVAFRKKTGEIFGEIDFAKAFDEDAVSLDETKIFPTGEYKAGIFASYHVYPYYPDFLRYDEKYSKASPVPGSNYYYHYLEELKNHYRQIPLLISEFGVPTSRGIARFHAEGFGHGGHNENEHADILKKLFSSIQESHCAGGIVFSWIDEWVKKSWMVKGTEERDQLWYNAQDPEESYGLIAITPSTTEKLQGNPLSWSQSTLLYSKDTSSPLQILNDGHDGARTIKRVFADADAGYLYLRIDVNGKIDWQHDAYLIGIDTFGTNEGNHSLPFKINLKSPIGFEYIILLHGEKSRILIDNHYNRIVFDQKLLPFPGLSGYRENIDFSLTRTDNGIFSEILTIHPRRFSRTGTIFPEKIYTASILKQGNSQEESLADFYYSDENDFIEIRIPWALLNFADPSRSQILFSGKEQKITEGIRILAVSYKPQSINNSDAIVSGNTVNISDMIPQRFGGMKYYQWKGWESPDYRQKPKKAYFGLKELFGSTKNPELRVNLPNTFDFTPVVKEHYDSQEKFDQLYLDSLSEHVDDNPYGFALANLAYGLVTKEPFYILEANFLFTTAESILTEPRKKELAQCGVQYTEHILSGKFPDTLDDKSTLERIEIKRIPIHASTFKKIIIGKSAIEINKNTRIKTQVDRVTRDWLMASNVTAAPSEIKKENIISWHEGEKIREIIELSGAKVSPVWGTRARKFGNAWYSPDDKGIYRFLLSEDKVYNYPTNIITNENMVFINDTHGISALAWDSSDVDLVVGCGDYEGKIEAAYYLAAKGIHVYMPTDRFLAGLIGTQTKGLIIGSAPVKRTINGAVIGDQPITIDTDETVIVSTSTGGYPLQYYDTPYRYFKELENYIDKPMHIIAVPVSEYGKANTIVDEARKRKAKLIGIRVWGKEEHDAVSAWLKEDKHNRAILFHSAVYPEGYRLFFEFPQQTTFGDIHIDFENE